ncbi:MAG TPA: TetR/AcrR family transcriptional regulator [Firmicutes bacterium]|nr:TetR/AcrR family transcriptional regulator [Bacillota bacterium]
MKKSDTKRPRRYLRSRITRKLILDTALNIFLTEGYKKTTITRISSQANVGYGTVYSHFKGKDDILAKILDSLLDEFYALLKVPFKPTSYTEARDIYWEVIETSFRLAEQHRPVMKVLREALGQSKAISEYWETMKNCFIASTSRVINQAQLIGLAKPDIDPSKAAKANVLLIDRFLWEVVQENETDIQYLSTLLTSMIFEGIFIKPASC